MIIKNRKFYSFFLCILIPLIAMAGCGGEGSGDSGGDNKQVNGSDTTAPTTPANLTATPISDSRIDLSWTASTDPSTGLPTGQAGSGQATGVAGYNIYRCAGSGCTPATLLTTSASTSYSDTALIPNTTYTYTVSAYDATGNESAESEGVSGTTLADNIVYAASCEQVDVQAAIDSASDGDTVMVPAGECTWTTLSTRTPSVQIVQKAITLQGAGIDQTVITDSTGSLVKEVLLSIDGQEGKSWRVTGFTFKGADTDIDYKGVIVVDGTSKSWRIDHCKFYDLKTTAIRVHGHTYGIIDHNEFIRQYVESDIYITHDGWGGESYGDGSWNSPLSLGTEQAIYIEDNTFTWNGGDTALTLLDAKAGGRLVFRYNTVYESGLGNHGTESGGRNRSVRSYEIYNNEFIRSNTQFRWTVFHSRGGTGVIFNNTITGNYNSLASVANYRDYHSFDPWGACDGTSPYDANDGITYDSGTHTGGNGEAVLTASDKNWIPDQWISYSLLNLDKDDSSIITSNTENTITVTPDGYAEDVIWDTGDSFVILRASICIDQIGRSTGNLLSDENPQWPQQELDPLYEWNNTINGEDANIKSASPHVQENRDYYNDTQKPDYIPYTYPHPLTLASATGNVYYVSPAGTASWNECVNIDTPCFLNTANTNATAGDVINLRGGTYNNVHIDPQNSGNSANKITWQAYNGETPVFTGDTPMSGNAYYYGVLLDGVDYHVIDGIEVDTATYLVSIRYGADYNEIKNSNLHNGTATGNGGLNIGSFDGTANTYNWIHDNTIYNSGYADPVDCNDKSNLMKIGMANLDYVSNYNIIENNVLYWGGHHVLEINTDYNVIRNNVFHNEGFMDTESVCTLCTNASGKYGNRNITISDGKYNLIENNRIGHAGLPSDGNGADGMAIGGPNNIVRHNFFYNNGEDGLYFRYGVNYNGDNNRVYSNTFYHNGYHDDCRTSMARYGIVVHSLCVNNVIKNNLLYDNQFLVNKAEIWCLDAGACATQTISNNRLTTDGDPLFVNPDISDPMSTTLPDLSLQSNSGAIDGGTYLTQANGPGTNSTTLIVDDALYFQDGSWGSILSNMQADWIAIGTVTNTVQISSINYDTNTITLASPMTWSDNANIWLYKNSSGNIVLRGSAPDIGAHEYKN